jgi:hypothetical protein
MGPVGSPETSVSNHITHKTEEFNASIPSYESDNTLTLARAKK